MMLSTKFEIVMYDNTELYRELVGHYLLDKRVLPELEKQDVDFIDGSKIDDEELLNR